MFLSDLNEHERKQFLDLAWLAVHSSGTIEESELEVYQSYAFECMMEGYSAEERTVEEITSELEGSTEQAKRIILIELMGVWAADNSWHDGEIDMMYKVGSLLSVSEALVNRLRRWTKELRGLVAEGCELIEG